MVSCGGLVRQASVDEIAAMNAGAPDAEEADRPGLDAAMRRGSPGPDHTPHHR
jgi:hypothetical protein